MIRLVALVLGAVLLSGCSSIPTMKRDDMSSFDQDNYQCRLESEAGQRKWPEFSRRDAVVRLYTLCMKARGYKKEE